MSDKSLIQLIEGILCNSESFDFIDDEDVERLYAFLQILNEKPELCETFDQLIWESIHAAS